MHVPGHTEGSCAILLEPQRALITGDALATRNPLTGRTGPQIGPDGLNHDSAQALRSLDGLASCPADLVLPGHGEPWTDGIGGGGSPGEGRRSIVSASKRGRPRPTRPRRTACRYAMSRRSISTAPSPTAPTGPRAEDERSPMGLRIAPPNPAIDHTPAVGK